MEKLKEALTAYELRPGATYALTTDRYLSTNERAQFMRFLERVYEDTGCKFVIFDGGVQFLQPPPTDTPLHPRPGCY